MCVLCVCAKCFVCWFLFYIQNKDKKTRRRNIFGKKYFQDCWEKQMKIFECRISLWKPGNKNVCVSVSVCVLFVTCYSHFFLYNNNNTTNPKIHYYMFVGFYFFKKNSDLFLSFWFLWISISKSGFYFFLPFFDVGCRFYVVFFSWFLTGYWIYLQLYKMRNNSWETHITKERNKTYKCWRSTIYNHQPPNSSYTHTFWFISKLWNRIFTFFFIFISIACNSKAKAFEGCQDIEVAENENNLGKMDWTNTFACRLFCAFPLAMTLCSLISGNFFFNIFSLEQFIAFK